VSGGPTPVVWTIPAGVPFLDTLAQGLIERHGAELADVLLLLPSRRACLAARDAFLRAGLGRPMLLPTLRPVGEAAEDELLLDGTQELELPPAIDPLRRQILLARLILAKDRGTTHDKALRQAASLARLLDECQTERRPLPRLDELGRLDLAEHWQETARFLEILREAWPAILAAEGALDPALRRDRLLAARAQAWRERPPCHPVVAAGTTGTVPAVAELLGVVARLRAGAVVVPGLDLESDEADWAAIGPVHPQYGLKRLLEAIGIARDAVRPWLEARPGPRAVARERLLRAAFRPAARTASWRAEPPPPDEALAGLEIIRAPDLASEALQLALRLREALETPGRTAALVTTDRNLARRVAVELGRWGVEVDDSAGVPLDQTPPAGLMLLAAHAVVDRFAPAALLALLKHPLARCGRPAATLRQEARALERAILRGPRPAGGLAGLRDALARAGEDPGDWRAGVPRAVLVALLVDLAHRLGPLIDALDTAEPPLATLLEAQIAATEALAADPEGDPRALWAGPAGEALAALMLRLRAATDEADRWVRDAWPAFLAVMMGGIAVRPGRPRHPRVAIWGRLEARLQRADLVLVGGLVEGAWPERAEPDPWLSPRMREASGLPPVEQRVGMAAHDLVQLATADQVVLSRAAKDEAQQPTSESRFLARLEALLRSTGRLAAVAAAPSWAAWAQALDRPAAVTPAERPAPCPPLEARPRELFVTDIERLIRDPYAFYARRILRLRALDPIDADPGAAERGQVLHTALQRFIEAWPGTLPEDGEARLIAAAEAELERFAHLPQLRLIWLERFRAAARWIWAQEQERRRDGRSVRAELTGTLRLNGLPGGPFTLRCRADRVELLDDRIRALIDYKTGTAPEPGQLVNGARPQLVLEGVIARDGVFERSSGADLAELAIWKLGGAEGGRSVAPKGELAAVVEQTRERLMALLTHYDQAPSVYPALPRPEIATASDYDHLSRLAEWRGAEMPDEP
jgi:ATP-dependent helicase/nuclease subunit B